MEHVAIVRIRRRGKSQRCVASRPRWYSSFAVSAYSSSRRAAPLGFWATRAPFLRSSMCSVRFFLWAHSSTSAKSWSLGIPWRGFLILRLLDVSVTKGRQPYFASRLVSAFVWELMSSFSVFEISGLTSMALPCRCSFVVELVGARSAGSISSAMIDYV